MSLIFAGYKSHPDHIFDKDSDCSLRLAVSVRKYILVMKLRSLGLFYLGQKLVGSEPLISVIFNVPCHSVYVRYYGICR
jgi:hypothetical protein